MLGITYASRLLSLAAAYKAKLLCSGVFVSHREAIALLNEDLAVDSLAPLRGLKATVDRAQGTVSVSLWGQFKRTALYRPGLGSTLVLGASVEELRSQSASFATWQKHNPRRHYPLPVASVPSPDIDVPQLSRAVENAFIESNPAKLQRTRAVVVLHRGRIVAERYAPGFSAEMPMLGWSMVKGVINALIGILVHQGQLSLDADDLICEWRHQGDPRRQITLDQLLRMSSGLQFSENYNSPLSDVTTMLFQQGDAAAYAAQLPLVVPPGSEFSYASGTTILLCRLLRQTLQETMGGTLADYFSFPRRALFDKLGMASAVLEPDAAGTFTGSSFMYATARDWAKLGFLYLQDGCWQGERILPVGWVAYSAGVSDTTPYYGAHFWRGVPLSFRNEKRTEEIEAHSAWPQDAYLASGHQGQMMTVVPSCDLVVVRLGLSQRRYSWDQERFITQVVRAVKR